MRKTRFLAVSLIVLFFGSIPLFAQQYDKELVVKVMRANGAALGAVTKAAGEKDFAVAAEKLQVMADGMTGIKEFTPPKGEQPAYKQTIEDFIAAANKGIAAAKAQDQAGLQAVIAELRNFMRQGHSAFKP
jgi:hypothetical protein